MSSSRYTTLDELTLYIMSVCTQEQEEELVTEIEPILKKFGGVCIVSDAKWIAH